MARFNMARFNEETFRYLEGRLASYLDNSITENAISGELKRMLSSDAVEAGPLRALGGPFGLLDIRQRLKILKKTFPYIEQYKNTLNIQASLLPEIFQIYIPVAWFLLTCAQKIREKEKRAALIGINGAQGSGKTTFNAFLQIILEKGFAKRVAGFSIDDVYKTWEERQMMSKEVHPLFAIRSVAGTHDTALARKTLLDLMHADSASSIALPEFDKMARSGAGDRVPADVWERVKGPVDIVLFEGWCVGADAQAENALKTPVNTREASDDPDGVWRNTMNSLLASEYRDLFALIDELLVIQVRSMDDVYKNRELQEQHLRHKIQKARKTGADLAGRGAMTPEEVRDFVAIYERTTCHMLETLPEKARLVLYLGEGHRVDRMRLNF